MKVNKTYRSLLDKSIGSMLSAIEIYNKPAFHNREEVFAILAVNSWELLLKAQWLRLNRFNIRSIYELQPAKNKNGQNSKVKKVIVNNRCGNPKTLSINIIMDNLRQRGLLKDNLRDNIESLIELRDNSIHFINPDPISKQVQELGFACIKNYMSIIKEWKIEIDLSSYNFYLMPLAYVDDKKVVTGTLTNETMNYINLVKEKVNHMDDTDLEYTVAISIDVEFKKVTRLIQSELIMHLMESKSLLVKKTLKRGFHGGGMMSLKSAVIVILILSRMQLCTQSLMRLRKAEIEP